MIFLTVGTQFPFDRLVKAVDDAVTEGKLGEDIFAQIGESSYKPRNFKAVSFMNRPLFDKYVYQASSIISHAGMGTIATAFECRKSMLVMPRQRKYGEVVNDHQLAIAKGFEEAGYILVANEADDIIMKIKQLKTFVPRQRNSQHQMVANQIAQFLMEIINK